MATKDHRKKTKKGTKSVIDPNKNRRAGNETIPEQDQVVQSREVLVPPDQRNGVYCNVAAIHHTRREFVLDFVFVLFGDAQVTSRVITSPQHAKEIYDIMGDNIKKYEAKYGQIEPKR